MTNQEKQHAYLSSYISEHFDEPVRKNNDKGQGVLLPFAPSLFDDSARAKGDPVKQSGTARAKGDPVKQSGTAATEPFVPLAISHLRNQPELFSSEPGKTEHDLIKEHISNHLVSVFHVYSVTESIGFNVTHNWLPYNNVLRLTKNLAAMPFEVLDIEEKDGDIEVFGYMGNYTISISTMKYKKIK